MRFKNSPVSTIGLLLAFVNVIGCLCFVLSRPPIKNEYLHELDNAKRQGVISINSAVSGIVACRIVSPWGEWHGDESWYVKVLEVANVDIIIPLLIVSVILERIVFIPTCIQSWITGIFFALGAAMQWYLLGRLIHRKVYGS